jgi:DNA-directed RNA polymerase, delta subunit
MIDYKQSSMVDIAFDLMKKKKKPVDFYKLWQEVSEIKGFDEEQKLENESLFYTNITLDGRLITVGENRWDLRSRHKFEEVHIDMNDIYNEEEEVEEEDEDDGSIEDDYN